MQRWLVSLALALCAGACAPKLWAPRMVPGCFVSSPVAELDRERGYHAALLALHERKYVILGAQPPSQIEAEYRSSRRPKDTFTHWSIAVRTDGALEVRSVPEATRVTREQETWFQRLSASVGKYQCRDLNWLRWEAQNHGLVPMGSAVPSEQGAGGEGPVSIVPPALGPGDGGHHTSAAPAPTAQGAASADALQRAVLDLQHERRQIRLVGPIVMLSVGVGFFGVGSGTLAVYSGFNHQDSDEACDDGACTERQRARALAIASAAFGLVFTGLVAVGATLLARRLRRQRAIDHELRRLLTPGLAYEPGQRHWQLALSATF